MASFACNSVRRISIHASMACSTRLTHKIECMMTGRAHGDKYLDILGNLYQYKFFLESHHSPKNTLCVLAMGQICQRRASVGDAPRVSAPAEAAPCMPKKHDPKRYANDYSRPTHLGWENEWLFKMPRCNEISWRDLTCSHVMFVLAPTPRTIMNVQCSICSKSPCNYMFYHFLGVLWSLMTWSTCNHSQVRPYRGFGWWQGTRAARRRATAPGGAQQSNRRTAQRLET